jgi:hypothetical protein
MIGITTTHESANQGIQDNIPLMRELEDKRGWGISLPGKCLADNLEE